MRDASGLTLNGGQMITLKEYQSSVIKRLEEAGVQCAENEAEQILLWASGRDRTWLYTSQRLEAGLLVMSRAEKLMAERLTGRPLQYILGTAYFMDLELKVDERVLIPRQDTELLAETAADFLGPKEGADVLDLCTGSGALAVYLKHEFPDANVTASDISKDALEIARKNGLKNGCYITIGTVGKMEKVKSSIKFVQSDLFEELQDHYDLIVTNPPYIATSDIEELQTEVKDHEPRLALDGGADGLDIVKKIIDQAPAHLKNGGLLLMEIGEDQGDEVLALAEQNGAYENVFIKQDLNGLDRMLYAQRRAREAENE